MGLLWIFTCLVVSTELVLNAEADLGGKAMVFPNEGDSSYAVLYPTTPLDLQQFTLCLRVSTEISGNREMILFSYFVDGDELNLWREKDGQLSLYIRSSSEVAKFNLPGLGALETHLCVTWIRSTGLTTFWFDGKRSLSKIYKKQLQIRPGGIVILGQDQDKHGSEFDAKQCFVGEISDVNLWNYVLPPRTIKEIYEGKSSYTGNIINWESVSYKLYGNVIIRD